MQTYRVAVITGTRAEYGLLRPVIKQICENPLLSLELLVTGSHLVKSLGYTKDEILADGYVPAAEVDILNGDENTPQSVATASALLDFSRYFSENKPEIAVVLGDRYEIFAAATAAATHGVPLAHISGGETTEGAQDEFFRHCITKMSYLHFPSTEPYRRRVVQLGESPERVVLTGSLGAENIRSLPLLAPGALGDSLNFNAARPFLLITYHPVTLGEGGSGVDELLSALDYIGMPCLFTKANADAGGAEINQKLTLFCQNHPESLLVDSLGALRYLSAMKACAAVVGNSSSAIVEAPTLKKPAVNIGDRQKGRIMGENTVCCPPQRGAIAAAITKAVSPAFAD